MHSLLGKQFIEWRFHPTQIIGSEYYRRDGRSDSHNASRVVELEHVLQLSVTLPVASCSILASQLRERILE